MDLAGLWASLAASIPAIIGGILLILIAWIVAVLVKRQFQRFTSGGITRSLREMEYCRRGSSGNYD